MFSRKAVVAIAALAPFVAAHGSLRFAIIDDTKFDGPVPNNNDGQQFAIRAINSVDPVKGATTRDLNCGQGATAAALVADANPGSVVKFNWANGEGGAWPHDTGPIMTYMASCGTGGCANFDPIDAQFFKIDQKGQHEDGTWFQGDIFNNTDATTNVTLPSDLPAGEYLIRHEIIGLHLANEFGGAEFYPSCLQVRMSQQNTTTAALPDSSETVTFPGGYNDNDPGIFVPGIFDGGLNYVFPGPNVISDAGSTPSNTDAPAPTATSSDPQTTPALPPCGGSKKMKRVVRRAPDAGEQKRSAESKRQHNNVAAIKREARPVVMSRVMRGIN